MAPARVGVGQRWLSEGAVWPHGGGRKAEKSGSVGQRQVHSRASERGAGQPRLPPPLACAALRAGLEGGGGPSVAVAAATLALGSARGQEEVYSATADPPDPEEQQVQDQMSFSSSKVLC